MPERLTAVGFLDETKAADETGVDGALRDLIRRMPVIAEREIRHREAVPGVSLAVSDHSVVLVLVVRAHPGAVVPLPFKRDEHIAGADARRRRPKETPIAKGTARHAHQRTVEDVEIVDV